MSRMARRAVIATKGGGGGVKTYADFQAHIAGLTSNTMAWVANDSLPATGGGWRTTATSGSLSSSSMSGSPWMATMARAGSPARIAQHALPSQAVWQAQIDGGLESYYARVNVAQTDLFALTRNGYTSTASFQTGATCSLCLYWDGTQAQQMNPLAGTGPTPYTW